MIQVVTTRLGRVDLLDCAFRRLLGVPNDAAGEVSCGSDRDAELVYVFSRADVAGAVLEPASCRGFGCAISSAGIRAEWDCASRWACAFQRLLGCVVTRLGIISGVSSQVGRCFAW